MRKQKQVIKRNIQINQQTPKIKKKKIEQSIFLPKLMNINPRSIYNKIDEFVTFVEEEEIDLVFMSESHERAYPTKMGKSQTLKEIIQMENFTVINNPNQRKEKCGRPALVINNKKYHVEDLTNKEVEVPWGVEIVWASITPKNSQQKKSQIQKIICASIYSKPNSRSKSKLLDHISDVYNVMSTKHQEGVHFILAGDTNDLKLDSILSLSPMMKQIVSNPTRWNPPRMIDPVITTLSKYYQTPKVLPPLDNDPDKDGKPSDHGIIVVEPISEINTNCVREKRKVIVRPMPESKLNQLKAHCNKWKITKESESAHKMAKDLHDEIVLSSEKYVPEKTRTISSDDQPWFSEKMKKLSKKKKQEFQKNRKSPKWMRLNLKYKKGIEKDKKEFYLKNVKSLRFTKPHQWYWKLKYFSNFDQIKTEVPVVESIKHLSDQEQAELIVEKLSKVGNEYDALDKRDISIPEFSENDIPHISQSKVRFLLKKLSTNKATVKDDVPAKIIKHLAEELVEPLTLIINTGIKNGQWPDIWKTATITPIPKEYPTKDINRLRGISGLFTESKVAEQTIAELMISDMKTHLDKSQYANQKGVSAQHYLIKMVDKILKETDNNSKGEIIAVLLTMVDWKEAFDRQCPKLGIEAFIKCGIRPALIPILINYFQDRKIRVKWHGKYSKIKNQNGGGPQGSIFGILEYLSQTNFNTEYLSEEEKYKFVDDLSILEILNLLTVGLCSYNVKSHVPSDIISDSTFIPKENLKTQQYLNNIRAGLG